MKTLITIILFTSLASRSVNAGAPTIKITKEWREEIMELAPAKPTAAPKAKRKVLLFSLETGYKHWVNPHTAIMIKTLAEKSKAFDVVESNDIQVFSPNRIKDFDALIFNNTCSDRKHRNIFLDVLGAEKAEEATALEDSLLSFVADGGGFVAIHGAITTFNSSKKFGEMLGGSFDFHPPQQEVSVQLVDPDHKLVQAFKGKPFTHIDEPYLFKGAYKDKNFRPLLKMDTSKLNCGKNRKQVTSDIRYIAWIKKHGKGRVFFVSPSHNAQSFSNPDLLQFYLDGIQYALGDLDCDDSPIGNQ